MEISSYIAYVLVSVGYIASPGPAVFLAINGGASLGVKSTAVLLFGNTIGLGVVAFISALGLGALILGTPLLTAIVKVAGACWLAWMGIKMMTTDVPAQTTKSAVGGGEKKRSFGRFNDGLLVALTNPKPIVFFISIYPQFVVTNGQEDRQLLLLGGTFMILSYILLNAYSLVSSITVGKVLNRTRVIFFNIIFGLLFVFLAILLILPVLRGLFM